MGYLRKIYMRNVLLTENIHEIWVTYGKYTRELGYLRKIYMRNGLLTENIHEIWVT